MSITGSIRSAAKRRGVSVYQIAKDTGLNQSGLNRFFNGSKDTLTTDVADKLLRYFELEVRPRGERRRK